MPTVGKQETQNDPLFEFQLGIRIPASLRDALYSRAEAEDRPVSRIVRRAIEEYLGLRASA